MEQPQHEVAGSKGEFFLARDGARLARMTYSRDGDTAIITHTEVDPSLRGRGAGQQLVAAAVEWARTEHIRVIPLCSFARSVFDRTPEYHNVL